MLCLIMNLLNWLFVTFKLKILLRIDLLGKMDLADICTLDLFVPWDLSLTMKSGVLEIKESNPKGSSCLKYLFPKRLQSILILLT